MGAVQLSEEGRMSQRNILIAAAVVVVLVLF